LRTNSRVEADGRVLRERFKTNSYVLYAFCVAQESPVTDGRVGTGGGVAEKSKRSIRRVSGARGVAKKRSSASGRIFVCGVRKERSRADPGTEFAVGEA
jgi:hypothetical protein